MNANHDHNHVAPAALLAHSNDLVEAIDSVSHVLQFMSMAIQADLSGSTVALDGAGLILETCANTLEFHRTKKGGAV
ncbi:MAG: hypothetical protein HZC22_10400 [Rhodocyclales bacterium]|nr:hypothetical protein [Rhodocyclales bacterium]